MVDQQTREQAGYIFSVGKMLRNHMHNNLTRLHLNDRSIEGCDLSIAQMNLLMTVRSSDDLTLSRLAELLKVSPPSVSVMVERLVERKMLIRTRSSRDRRKVIISLSPESEERIDKMEEQMLASFIELVEELGPETARKWGEVLERVEEVLRRQNRQGKETCS
ncbi:MarR family winged helix-turn-helix transcriptional regulator [Candidatus Electrothrix sp.]|uniref:MarR family winged helix-turn-helix transcriptional regulator n=1 Tax=Candidatus Electrothrix sp. TaxID=2170559 RepID=UPI004056385F